MFELTTLTAAQLTSVTNRVERHGDDSVPAISLGLKIETANTVLDRLSATLRHTLYKAADDQEDLPGVEQTTPLLRTRGIEMLALAGALEGWTLHVDHGIDEDEPITFGSCKVDKFRVAPKEGGTVELLLRVGTSDIDADKLGVIGMKNGQEIMVTLTAPQKLPEAIDGSQAAFEAETGAGPLFEDGEQSEEEDPVLGAARDAHGVKA